MAADRPIASFAAAVFAVSNAPTFAATVMTSPAPDSASVTIYREPNRRHGSEMNLDWLRGYALVTERRTVDVPAGDATIRFEGVAGGMLPESAMVTGLPQGVREKNLDADLLSPGSLYARAFGRPVTLRREHKKTGKIVEEDAIIRSGPDGAILLQTAEGFEAAKCGPLNDSLIYPGVPPGLSARPTLSIQTSTPTAARVTLLLSYLAWGFDWQTNYVLRMRESGTTADLDAWVTLASSDPTSFVDAQAAVVGGEVNREDEREYRQSDKSQQLVVHCLLTPVAVRALSGQSLGVQLRNRGYADIVVTAMRRTENLMSVPLAISAVMSAEGLGDLKLYRMPIATTVASNSQKQIALFERRTVKISRVYMSSVTYGFARPANITLRTRNDKQNGLGLALPNGAVTIFEPLHGEPMLIGKSAIADKAIGEDVEIPAAISRQVNIESFVDGKRYDPEEDGAYDFGEPDTGKVHQVALAVSNANPHPINFEALVDLGDDEDEPVELFAASTKVDIWRGRKRMKLRVPAHGRAVLRYKLRRIESDL